MEIIRSLVDRIVLSPMPEGSDTTMAIDLHGDLAGILSLSAQTKKPPKKGGDFDEFTKLVAGAGFGLGRLGGNWTAEFTKLVAGIGFEPMTFRL